MRIGTPKPSLMGLKDLLSFLLPIQQNEKLYYALAEIV
jgi:hypothetical protein